MYFESYRDFRVYFHKGDNICGAHFHRSIELLYILSGEKEVFLNGQRYLLQANELLVCPPQSVHIFMPSNGEQIVVTIPSEFCRSFETFCKTRVAESPVICDRDGTFLKLFEALESPANDILFEGITNCLLGIYISRTKFRSAKEETNRLQVREIADYIDRHFSEEISLESIAHEFGYSPNYFSSLFKKSFRTGFSQYVNSVRLQKSLPLLQTQKISAVYFLCGFKSPQQYFLNFKKFFGCTPLEYLNGQKTQFPI